MSRKSSIPFFAKFFAMSFFTLLFSIASYSTVTAENQLKEHPAITPYVGSKLTERQDEKFKEYKAITGVNLTSKSEEEVFTTTQLTGTLSRLSYDNPKGRSILEIATNYREALERSGFKIIFSCAEKTCGPSYASSRWSRVNGLKYFSPQMHYIIADKSSTESEVFVAVSITKDKHQIDILERTTMETGLVTITAEAIKSGLLADGRAVLDGIFFEHDKAVIKPESKAALTVIAQFLKDNSELKVYIVGHTDSSGSLEYNMNLSRERAAAVVAALVKDFAVDKNRLSAHGVGPLSPSKANKSEDGRAQNRRVEMVEQ